MRISLSEFREMIEEHYNELRQAQEEYNEMYDQKEIEIKHLKEKFQATKQAFAEYRSTATWFIGTLTMDGELKEYITKALNNEYHKVVKELEKMDA